MAAVEGGPPADGDRSGPVSAVILGDDYCGPDTVQVSAGLHGEVGGGKSQQSTAGIAVLDDAGDNLVLGLNAFDRERSVRGEVLGTALPSHLPHWDPPRCGQGPHQFTSRVVSSVLRRGRCCRSHAGPADDATRLLRGALVLDVDAFDTSLDEVGHRKLHIDRRPETGVGTAVDRGVCSARRVLRVMDDLGRGEPPRIRNSLPPSRHPARELERLAGRVRREACGRSREVELGDRGHVEEVGIAGFGSSRDGEPELLRVRECHLPSFS